MENRTLILSSSILGVFIAIGLIGMGFFIGNKFLEAKKLDRVVTVKGLAEKVVKADLAIWPIKFRGSGDDLQALNTKIEMDRKKVIEYFKKQGIAENEIEIGNYQLIDLMSKEYRSQSEEKNRYIISGSIELITNKVDLVKKLQQQVHELIKEGIIIDTEKGPKFEYTKFNEIKLLMIEEANKNSENAAIQFANNSNSKLGGIKKANQGMFLIEAPFNVGSEDAYENKMLSYMSINKKIRVVTTVDYYLVD